MSGTQQTLPSVRDNADKIIDGALKSGRIAPADDANSPATFPAFSAGTRDLDGNGKPITQKPPAFESEHRDLPATASSDGKPNEAITTPADEGAPPTQASAPASAPAQDPSKPAQPAQTSQPAVQAGASAAEATAQAIADEFEEFEVDEPDHQVKVKVRAPKQYAPIIKSGYSRRADYDRKVSYLQNARAVLEPMITDGRIQQVLPMLRAAIENQQFGEYVTAGFTRLQRGEPLVQQAMREAAAAQEAATRLAPTAAPTPEEAALLADPFLAEQFRPIQQKYDSELAAMQRRMDESDRVRQEAERRAQEQQAQSLQQSQQMAQAHADLAAMFPGQFNTGLGPNDPFWQRACTYARDAGYLNRPGYGLAAAIIFGGQQVMAIERERLSATASPTATAMAQVDAHLLSAAQQQAAQAAGAVSGGAPAATAATPIPPKPTPRNADGSLKPQAEYMASVAEWHRAHNPAFKQ